MEPSTTGRPWPRGSRPPDIEPSLVGKYLNGYGGTYRPPGWDKFIAFAAGGTQNNGAAYYNYELNVDGTLVNYGSADADYSTDVLAPKALDFINQSSADQPFFLYFAPFAPHGPATPAPRHQNALSGLSFTPPPNLNEKDVSDKPAFIRNLALKTLGPAGWTKRMVASARPLLAVDEAISSILGTLASSNRLSNTIVVFLSDNGFAKGEHRWTGKETAYEETIRVPMVIRYDALGATSRTDPSLVLNIDLAPTLAELAGPRPQPWTARASCPCSARRDRPGGRTSSSST